MTDALNQWRQEHQLSWLEEETLLTRTAEKYAIELLEKGYLTHLDDSGNTCLWRYREQGGTATSVGEVLATQNIHSSRREILNLWLESEKHYAVIMDPRWSCYGVGFAENERARVIVFLFSNSYLLHPLGAYTWEISDSPGEVVFPLDGIRFPYQSHLLDLSQWSGVVPRFMEIRDLRGEKRNRLIIPADADRGGVE